MNESSSVSRAVVLAAGRGSRLNSDTPKPLQDVLGLPLLARTLFTLQRAGVTDVWVVLGYEHERVRREMQQWMRPGLHVHWVLNPEWRKPNGVSVLAAEGEVEGPFFLTMTDHIFPADGVEELARRGAGDGVSLLVDHDVDQVLDLDDATKVRVRDGHIEAIGKDLEEYDAIDTGVFLATPALFDAIREARSEGEASLSAGVQRLAAEGRARVVDIEGRMWQDVDTAEDLAVAKKKLLDGLRKDSDGPIARYLNRPVSTRISSLLVHTPVTPNQISVSTLVMSVAAAAFAAMGGYLNFLAAGLLFHLASIVDGVDGEVAKLKFMTSRRGEWIDTVCDNLGYVVFLAGLIVGAYRADLPPLYVQAGAVGLVAATGSILNLTWSVAREESSGSFLSVEYGYEEGTGLGSRIMQALHFMGKRDFLAFLALVLAVIGHLPFGLILFGVGATLLLFPATLKANISSWRRERRRGLQKLSSSEAGG